MERVFIIAEAGDNHNGDFDLALQLVDKAAEAGADCVKFQTFVTENVVSVRAEKAAYQKENTAPGENQFDMIKKYELSFEQYREIQKYCGKRKIMFLSTPFDLDSIDFLQGINIPFWKIPSGEITNLPYLEKIAKTGKNIVLSTGMSTMDEIGMALDILRQNGAGKITLLQCNTEYPTPYEDANIKAMEMLRKTFHVPVGYSDHSLGIEIPIAAVACGATIIEKHFTLSKSMEGPDHKASLEPDELKNMVSAIRHIEAALGNGDKKPSPSEIKNKEIARKSIVANCNIKKGELLTEANLYIKRPGNGISPMKWHEVIGSRAVKDFCPDELIVL